jgi:hypothetical protein
MYEEFPQMLENLQTAMAPIQNYLSDQNQDLKPISERELALQQLLPGAMNVLYSKFKLLEQWGQNISVKLDFLGSEQPLEKIHPKIIEFYTKFQSSKLCKNSSISSKKI